jgi:hypothetical protein
MRIIVLLELTPTSFPVRTQHALEERRRHLVMLGIGGIRMFGNGPRRQGASECFIALRIAGGEARSRARAESMDRDADQKIRQRNALGAADHFGSDTHFAALASSASCGGSGKKTLVRDWYAR